MLSGPHRPPKSGRAPDSLVVMLHGVGANGDDLIGLADILGDTLPNTAFHAPNAPFPFSQGGFGYQWYAREPRGAWPDEVRKVEPMVNEFIEELAGQYELEMSRCVLLGFSQGCVVTIHTAPRRAAPLAGVVAFSGAMITGDTLAMELASKSPVVLVHGADDEVVPPSRSELAAERLRDLGVPVSLHILPGLGHGIDQRGLGVAIEFMKRVLLVP